MRKSERSRTGSGAEQFGRQPAAVLKGDLDPVARGQVPVLPAGLPRHV